MAQASPSLRLLEARFDLPLLPAQIPQWRGAFAQWAGLQEDIYHNHAGAADEYHRRYPLVQYRSVRGKATIFAVNDGVEAVADLLQRAGDWQIRWQDRPTHLRIEHLRIDTSQLDLLPAPREYRLLRWLALNADNYRTWQQLRTYRERVELLDRCLAANLLSLCSGLHWQVPRRFEAYLTSVERMGTANVHGQELITFDCTFSTDLALPLGLGLGKSTSHGFGVLLGKRVGTRTDGLSKDGTGH